MYVSPLSERLRKRKAFADRELDTSASCILASAVSIPPYAINYDQLSREHYTSPIPSLYDHNQHYARPKLPSVQHYPHFFDGNAKEKLLPKIRLVDESKLKETTYDLCNSEYKVTNAKPKISFSIDSIIGIH